MNVQILLKVFQKPKYLISLIVLTIFLLAFFILIQIYFTPEYKTQPQLIFLVLKPKDWFLLILFVFLVALNFVLSFHNWSLTNKFFDTGKSLIQNISAIFSSLFTSIAATTFCTSCLVSVLSFLGTSTAFGLAIFSLKYKSWIVFGNFTFLGLLTFYNLKRVERNEKKCNC